MRPKPWRVSAFRNCFGTIWSVSTLTRSSGMTIPVCVLKVPSCFSPITANDSMSFWWAQCAEPCFTRSGRFVVMRSYTKPRQSSGSLHSLTSDVFKSTISPSLNTTCSFLSWCSLSILCATHHSTVGDVEFADVDEVAGDGGCCGHDRATRCVRQSLPWRPSKLRLEVLAQRSCCGQHVVVHADAHAAACVAPFESGFA